MDNSLRFPSEKEKCSAPGDRNSVTEKKVQDADLFRDYRGVACPMNFVKVKLDLATLKRGQRLKVLLDDGAPIENVPRSVAEEGHKVAEQVKAGNHWSLLIEKN